MSLYSFGTDSCAFLCYLPFVECRNLISLKLAASHLKATVDTLGYSAFPTEPCTEWVLHNCSLVAWFPTHHGDGSPSSQGHTSRTTVLPNLPKCGILSLSHTWPSTRYRMYFPHKFHFLKLASLSSLFHNVGDTGSFPRLSWVLSSNILKETTKLGRGRGGVFPQWTSFQQ